MWIAQRRFEQSELFAGGFNRLRAERDSNDRMFGSKILQMRLEYPEQKIDVVCRLRNFENSFVYLFARHGGFVLARIRERESQRQFFCDQINCAQAHGELLQKTTQ